MSSETQTATVIPVHKIDSIIQHDDAPPSSPSASLDERDPSSADDTFKPDMRIYLAFLTLAVLTLMVALDATSLSVALAVRAFPSPSHARKPPSPLPVTDRQPKQTIATKLHGTAIEAFWAGTSFLLTSTVFQPVYASLSHIFGRRPLVIVGIVLFLVGALVGGLARNFTHMLVGRSIQGMGGGGIMVLTEIIITDLIPLRDRGKWFGIISSMWAIGSVAGYVIDIFYGRREARGLTLRRTDRLSAGLLRRMCRGYAWHSFFSPFCQYIYVYTDANVPA